MSLTIIVPTVMMGLGKKMQLGVPRSIFLLKANAVARISQGLPTQTKNEKKGRGQPFHRLSISHEVLEGEVLLACAGRSEHVRRQGSPDQEGED